jgi:hypothetical protein
MGLLISVSLSSSCTGRAQILRNKFYLLLLYSLTERISHELNLTPRTNSYITDAFWDVVPGSSSSNRCFGERIFFKFKVFLERWNSGVVLPWNRFLYYLKKVICLLRSLSASSTGLQLAWSTCYWRWKKREFVYINKTLIIFVF